MLQSIRSRFIVIGLLIAAAAYGLWPRQVTRRIEVNGVVQDTVVREWNIRKGLDLQGGMHIALEIDEGTAPVANPADALDRTEAIIRNRIDEFGVAEPLVQRVGTERLLVQLPGIDDPERARDIIERSAFLEFRITDMDGRFIDALPRIDAALLRAGVTARSAGPAQGALQQLLGADSAAAPDDSAAAPPGEAAQADSVAPSEDSPPVFSSLLQQQGTIAGELLVTEEDFEYADSLIGLPEFQRAVPRGLDLVWSVETLSFGGRSYRPLYAVDNQPIITGVDLSDAQAQIDPTFNQAVVNFQLNRAGGRKFGRETARHIGDYMAIVLDGLVQGRPPVIRSQIRRRGQIELGSASIQDAQDLALVLRAGALPAPITIVEERTVGPSLGQDSIDKGTRAGMIAVLLVIGIIAVYYRVAGLFAIGALVFYVVFTLGGLGMLEAVLTLPGLAGFVLSLGLAVDANVLIFERIREELAAKKSPRIAVDSGFAHAMPAIVDANVTTIITALFLLWLGTGPVRGFAVTLIIGIVASLLTAVFVTRTFFLVWLQRRAATTELSI